MNDGFKTSDIFFAAAMMHLYTEDALTRIDTAESESGRYNRQVDFYLDIPSLDAAEFETELKQGRLDIADLKSYIRTYTFLTRKLREMKMRNELSWTSPSWVRGRG